MIAKVIEVDKILEQTLLFDFYGELLTEHQKEIYERFVTEDLSLGEVDSRGSRYQPSGGPRSDQAMQSGA